MHTIRISKMTWKEIHGAITKGYTKIILGIGATEQHGPHLPLGTDFFIGDALANRVAKLIKNTLQAPTLAVGCSEHHMDFPGSMTIQEETLKGLLLDCGESLLRHPFETLILIPSHGGNFKITGQVIATLRKKYPNKKVAGYTELNGFLNEMNRLSVEKGISVEESGAHAGESETAIIQSLNSQLVRQEMFTPGFVGRVGKKEIETIFSKGLKALSDNGVLGDPTKALKENGEYYLQKLAKFLAEKIQEQLNEN